MERVIDPVVADLQREYADARAGSRAWRSQWIRVAGYLTVIKVLALVGLTWVFGGSPDWTSDDRRAWTRTLSCSGLSFMFVTALLVAPSHGLARSPELIVLLLPQAFPIALPLALMFGVFLGVPVGVSPKRISSLLLAVGIVGSAVSLAVVAWVMPSANQAFRVLLAGHPVLRGVPELSLAELGQLLRSGGHAPIALVYPIATLQEVAWNYHVRYALSCAPFVLILLALSIVFRNPSGRMNRAAAACAAAGFYYLCLWGGRPLVLNGSMPAFAAVWLPNVLIGLSSIALMAIGRQGRHEPDSQILNS